MRQAIANRVGMAVFLASWTMLIVALSFVVVSLRRVGVWQPLGPSVGWLVPVSSVLVVCASSVAMWRRRALMAVALGMLLVGCQLVLLSRATEIASRGRDVIWLLAGFHLAHLVIGGFGVARAMRSHRSVGLWAAYWHALTAAWLLFAGVLFL